MSKIRSINSNQLYKTINPDGSIEQKTYDESGYVKTDITTNKTGKAILSYEYSYDGFGNITSVKDNIDFSGDVDYSKEASGEVTFKASSSDADSNETSGEAIYGTSTVEMKYDEANRLISYNGEEVKYDADGNMIYGPLDGKMTEFQYDSRNRLVRAGDIIYKYDAENIRIAAVYPDYTEEYVTDRESDLTHTLQIIRYHKNSEADEDSEADNNYLGSDTENASTYSYEVNSYYYGVGLIYEKAEDKILVYHFDHLGSTRNVTDENGDICYSFKYGTYGELLSIWDGKNTSLKEINKNHPVRFLYNGALGVITDNNGLMYMRQRYYNTEIKRFINQDILYGNTVNSQSLNRYAYVQGNPVNYNDPFGLSPRQILKPYVNLAHDLLRMAAIIPGPVGVIAGLCDIGLSYATGDYGAISDTILNCLIMRGMGGLIGNFCKLPKFAKYLVGGVLFKFGVDNISKAKDQIENAANMLVDLMEQGGDIFSYVHAISEMTQGIGFLCGSVKFTTDVSVGMYRQCFVAGTKVKTEDGDKNIEEIKAGDKVWSYNPATGETGLKTVKQTFENETKQIVHVTISDGKDIEEIDTTVRHPFYVVDYGFKYASELRIGDKVISVSGDIYEVTFLEIENLDTPVKVYNFEVEDWHTYFVSASGILVHNECITDGKGTTNASTTEDDKKQGSQNTSTNQIEVAISSGYKQDNNGRWHRPNGEFASNEELGIESPVKSSSGTHGNSLSDPRTNYGYVLIDENTKEILKFGETIHPDTRYSKKYLKDIHAKMIILETGSKREIHEWQHGLNEYYKKKYNEYPPLNKEGW